MTPWEFARRYAEKPERLVVGLMSGTSVDGVDIALVRISGSARSTRVELAEYATFPIPASLRQAVLALSHGEGNAETVSRANIALGHLFARAASTVLKEKGATDLIASHGQTISHTPAVSAAVDQETGATLQIGDAAVIAQTLGIPVLSDFRSADMAVGGQGAPLVPYADWCLLTHPTRARCVQNIGGIGNVTYLPADAAPGDVLGFDTGPGNMLIDRAAYWATQGVLTYDREGALAFSGEVNHNLLEWLLTHPFLQRIPPKSAGREEFGEVFWQEITSRFLSPSANSPALHKSLPPNDIVATLTAYTAISIAEAYERFLPSLPAEVIVGGGGARNPILMKMLSEKMHPIPVLTHEEVGINGDMKEAVAFALLANETMLGNRSNLPSVTGASRPVLLGKLTLP